MDQLFINDIEVDLYTDTTITLNFQINDLAELKDRQANFSNQFKIPKTKRNIETLGWSNLVQSTTEIPYTRNVARVIKNGTQVVPNGIAIVESVEKEFNVVVYSGNLDFFERIQDLRLSDLNLISLDHVWNLANVVAANANTTGYKYPIIDYGNLSNANRDINPEELRAAVFMHTAINKIIEVAGFTLQGAITADPNYLKILIPFANSKLRHSQRWIDNHSFRVSLSPYTITESGGAVTHNYWVGGDNDSTNGFYDRYDQVTIGAWAVGGDPYLLYFTHNELGKVKHRFVFNFTVTNWIDGTSTFGIDLAFSGSVGALYVHPDTAQGGGNGTFSVSFELLDDHNITVPGDERPISVGVLNCDIDFAASTWEGEADEHIYYGSTINVEANLPDISQKDLIKTWGNLFALFFCVDTWTNTMYLARMNDIVNNIPFSLDWSDKLHNEPDTWKLEFRLPKYGQKSRFTYEEDGGDESITPELGNGYFDVNDTTLDPDQTVVTLPFSATHMDLRLENLPVPLIEKIDDDGNFTIDTNPRLLIDDTQHIAGDPIHYEDSGFVTSDETQNIPLCYFQFFTRDFSLGFDHSILDDYYDGLIDVLEKVKKLTALFKLDADDISRLEQIDANTSLPFWFTPIYLWQFSSYFYINKITGFTGKGLTKVELIRLGGGDVCIPTFGEEIVVDGDFPDPNVNWGESGGLGSSFTYGQPGVSYDDNGTAVDGALTQFPPSDLNGTYKIEIDISGRTAGSVWAAFNVYETTHFTGNGTNRELLEIPVNVGVVALVQSADFDGVVTRYSIRQQLTCLNESDNNSS